MVLRFLGRKVGQCEIASRALGLTSCCPDGTQAGCNVMIHVSSPSGVPRDIVGTYGLFGVGATFQRSSLRPVDLGAEIKDKRPVQAYLARGGGRGHVVLVVGVQPSGDESDPWVIVIDPEPKATKQGKVRYRELRAGLGAGIWDGTVFRIGA